MKNIVSVNNAITSAIAHADISSDIIKISAVLNEEYYEIDFCTDYLEYICYVEAYTGEVIGFSFTPVDNWGYADYDEEDLVA